MIERKIIIGKQRTYDGVKRIEIEYDPFDEEKKFEPIRPYFKLEKYNGKWQVYRGEFVKDPHALHCDDFFFEKRFENLREAKKYAVERLQKSELESEV